MNGLLRSSVLAVVVGILAMPPAALAESDEVIQGFPLLTVLPVGAIPAV
jgi:hypothetical protein